MTPDIVRDLHTLWDLLGLFGLAVLIFLWRELTRNTR